MARWTRWFLVCATLAMASSGLLAGGKLVRFPDEFASGYSAKGVSFDPPVIRCEVDLDHDEIPELLIGDATTQSSNGVRFVAFRGSAESGYVFLGELWFHRSFSNLRILPAERGQLRLARTWHMGGGETGIGTIEHDGVQFILRNGDKELLALFKATPTPQCRTRSEGSLTTGITRSPEEWTAGYFASEWRADLALFQCDVDLDQEETSELLIGAAFHADTGVVVAPFLGFRRSEGSDYAVLGFTYLHLDHAKMQVHLAEREGPIRFLPFRHTTGDESGTLEIVPVQPSGPCRR